MSNTARFKLVTETGDIVDFLVDAEEGDLGSLVLTEISALKEAGFKSMALINTAQVGPAPAAPAAGFEPEVSLENAKPGALASRFRNAVIVVTPRQDGKALLEFYGDDKIPPKNEFPYAKQVYKIETWVKKFADVCNFTAADFSVAAQYAVTCDVEVRYGDKVNSAGNLYRNVGKITLSPGVGFQEVTRFEQEGETVDDGDVPF